MCACVLVLRTVSDRPSASLPHPPSSSRRLSVQLSTSRTKMVADESGERQSTRCGCRCSGGVQHRKRREAVKRRSAAVIRVVTDLAASALPFPLPLEPPTLNAYTRPCGDRHARKMGCSVDIQARHRHWRPFFPPLPRACVCIMLSPSLQHLSCVSARA